MLIAYSNGGCSDTATIEFKVKDDFKLWVPNAFTPEGDGLNETFNVHGLTSEFYGYEMQIYDRWGSKVYHSNNIAKGWDGTVNGKNGLPGVYVYIITMRNPLHHVIQFKGAVTLLR
jgi:gliding motility-associated-like protein